VSKILLAKSPESRLPGLESALSKKGYTVLASLDLDALKTLDETSAVDLSAVILGIVDVSCGRDGTVYCQAFHDICPLRPLILLVEEGAIVSNECQQLTCGNVLQLPFTPRKVLNRVARLLNYHQGSILKAGRLTLNLQTRCVSYGEVMHRLTPKQAELLQVFMEHAGQTLTRKFLMATVWNTDYMGDTRTLDVHVRWIRERIEDDPGNPQYLRTVRGVGYRFGAPAEE
jgi:two-component system alkaline phosphatase synthesis response regulator PhoP